MKLPTPSWYPAADIVDQAGFIDLAFSNLSKKKYAKQHGLRYAAAIDVEIIVAVPGNKPITSDSHGTFVRRTR